MARAEVTVKIGDLPEVRAMVRALLVEVRAMHRATVEQLRAERDDAREQRDQAFELTVRAHDEAADALRRLHEAATRVRAIHAINAWNPHYCVNCRAPYPCRTIRALDEDNS